MGRNLDAQRRASTSKAPERWGGFLSWVVRLTFHAGCPEPGTRRHTGTQAAGPPPPRSSPASSHAPWPRPQIGRPGLVQQTFRARREHAATALSPPASEALPRTSGIMSHDPSCDWTVSPASFVPPPIPSTSFPRPGCVTWENLERQLSASGATLRGTTPPPRQGTHQLPVLGQVGGTRRPWPKCCSPEAGSRPDPGPLYTSASSQGAMEPWCLEPRAPVPGTVSFDPGTALLVVVDSRLIV